MIIEACHSGSFIGRYADGTYVQAEDDLTGDGETNRAVAVARRVRDRQIEQAERLEDLTEKAIADLEDDGNVPRRSFVSRADRGVVDIDAGGGVGAHAATRRELGVDQARAFHGAQQCLDPVAQRLALLVHDRSGEQAGRHAQREYEAGKRQADEGLDALKQNVDTLIVIPNDRLLTVANDKTSVLNAFKMADEVLLQGVSGITGLITTPGLINTDFAETEVDTRRTNLTRFPLFFPEKRPFFLENAGLFLVGSIPFWFFLTERERDDR